MTPGGHPAAAAWHERMEESELVAASRAWDAFDARLSDTSAFESFEAGGVEDVVVAAYWTRHRRYADSSLEAARPANKLDSMRPPKPDSQRPGQRSAPSSWKMTKPNSPTGSRADQRDGRRRGQLAWHLPRSGTVFLTPSERDALCSVD